MNINTELVGIIIGIIFQGLYIAHRMGRFETKLDCIEEKQDKHNNLIERMVRVEDSTKSLHHRMDEMQDNCHKVLRRRLKQNE
jgi:dsDNA-specific endonuclease/ATPase MutS2